MKELELFQERSSPYKTENRKYAEEFYESYCNDPCGIIEQNGEKYYRIIARSMIKIGNDLFYLVNVDRRIGMKTDSVFEDENGNQYKFHSTVHYRFSGKTPTWYFEAPEIMIKTESDNLGEYLKICEEE